MKKILALLALCSAGALFAEDAVPAVPAVPAAPEAAKPAAPAGDVAKARGAEQKKAFEAWLAKEENLKKYDTDGNGKVEKTEMRAARQAWMKETGVKAPERPAKGDKAAKPAKREKAAQ
jgi:hypothetical protein